MMNNNEINAGTLRSWLESGEPVEVIDIRPHADFEGWHNPGSHNVDAYQAIYANSPGPLVDYEAPDNTKVVAVCFVGQTSLRAAHYLASRGIQALSLAGGMRAWSLAWNTAEIPIKNNDTTVIQVRRTGKGCLSYLIGSNGEALVIDSSVDPQVYVDLAAERDMRITKVLDTHIHADHLSRSITLAEATGAPYLLPTQERVAFDYQGIEDGELIAVGDARIRAIRTPGHTIESMSYFLEDEALFSGDTLFIESVGRPDLKAIQDETAVRARALYETVQGLVALDGDILVLPCHTGRPVAFDGVAIAAPLKRVVENVEALGYEEERFISWILERLPPNPPNYEFIVQLNEAGVMPALDPTQFEAGANHCAV